MTRRQLVLSNYSTETDLLGVGKTELIKLHTPALGLFYANRYLLTGTAGTVGWVAFVVVLLITWTAILATPSKSTPMEYLGQIVSHYTGQQVLLHERD